MQLAAVEKLASIDYTPNLTLASSGGTVASYVASAAKWKSDKIRKVSQDLNHTLFIRSWFSPSLDFIHSIMAGFFYGAVYKNSQKTIHFFKKYFTALTITEYEIWVGAVNYRTGAFCLFCNRSKFESQLPSDQFNINLCKAEPPRYLGGDVRKITNSVMASSSVPIMVEPRIIDGQPYIDSGAKFASPLTPLQDEVITWAKNEKLHMIYVNGYNVEADTTPGEIVNEFNIFSGSTSVTEHIVRGFMLHDRISAVNIIKSRGTGNLNYFDTDIRHLSEIMYRLEEKTAESLIEIYPKNCYTIDLVSFTGATVIESIDYAKKFLGLRIWWNGDKTLFDDYSFEENMPETDLSRALDSSMLISSVSAFSSGRE